VDRLTELVKQYRNAGSDPDIQIQARNQYAEIADEIESAIAAELSDAKKREMQTEDYVAWLRYIREGERTRIVVCDSDADGAFKAYRHSKPETQPVPEHSPYTGAIRDIEIAAMQGMHDDLENCLKEQKDPVLMLVVWRDVIARLKESAPKAESEVPSESTDD
jgi:hypothetical protein